MWMLDGNVDAWACRHIGVQMWMVVDADVSMNKIYFFDHADGCVRGHVEGRHVCMHAWCTHTDMDEGKGEKKEHTDLRWTQCADGNECKKKEKKGKKKTYLKWGHADVNMLHADALYEDIGGGSCRDGC